MKVWIVGRNHDERTLCAWSVLGIYSNENQAIERCNISDKDWIAPFDIDTDAPEDATEWPGAYFPLDRASVAAHINRSHT